MNYALAASGWRAALASIQAIKAAARIKQLFETIFAHRRIGADAGERAARPRCIDGKTLIARRRAFKNLDRVDARQRRRLCAQRLNKRVGARTLDLDQHAFSVVAHEAGEVEF